MATLKLGKVDKGKLPKDPKNFLAPYHASMSAKLQKKHRFRDEGVGIWRSFLEVEGTEVQELQHFLQSAGFMPNGKIDGIYGYGTMAAVRLFQEYVRTIEGKETIGIPDGVAGKNTKKHIRAWMEEKLSTPDFVCDWGKASVDTPTESYRHWLSLLQKGQAFYQENSHAILEHIEAFSTPTDTKKIVNWNTSNNTIHLIGIRRSHDQSYMTERPNDDLFVLLLNGLTFYFWGSTDPNPGMTDRKDLPFLIEGQHDYSFGWHKVTDENKVYRALRPSSNGVLVFRDKDGNKALTEADLVNGLDATPNNTINIHWSGIGKTNFSAGCQVIAGASYINHKEDIIDCRDIAATSYGELGSQKTRGAYNLIADLILTYAPVGVRNLTYTLTRDDTAFLSDELTVELIGEVVGRLNELTV